MPSQFGGVVSRLTYRLSYIVYEILNEVRKEQSIQDRKTRSVTPRVWLKKDWSDYLYHQRCTFLFEKPTRKNFIVKCAYWGAILGWVTSWEVSWIACEQGRWVTSWEVSRIACEQGRSTSERLVMICGASQRSLKLLLVRPAAERGRSITDGIRADSRLWAAPVDGELMDSHLARQRY